VIRGFGLTRRELAPLTAGAAGLAAALGAWSSKSRAEQRALRLIARSDLRLLDPIWTTQTEWLRLTRRDFDKEGGRDGTDGHFFSDDPAGSGEDRFSSAACQRYAIGGTLRR
jgi:hypothetical protein